MDNHTIGKILLSAAVFITWVGIWLPLSQKMEDRFGGNAFLIYMVATTIAPLTLIGLWLLF